MDLANQSHLKNPLDDPSLLDENSTMKLKCLNDEYSIQLDADTMKYLTAKKKPALSVFNEDEHDMRKINIDRHHR